LEKRTLSDVTTVVLHATEERTLQDARAIAERSSRYVAAHYYIDRDGTTELWIPLDRIANHTFGHNRTSIGIELVNLGRYPDHYSTASQEPTEPFPESQIRSLERLLASLRCAYPTIVHLARHSDLDRRLVSASDCPKKTVRRRIDPGPLFPWHRVSRGWAGAD
jgi:N-acetylmuramoyl-L-alanine amidase